ncbi:unnamed protein product [Oikopleura dioica]|uniref:WH2 domain-containing protein n=1 Tax=Oikopleura dioica TaxID=34765 RepID=E4XRJ0_OIKDI|nr:unnamed protein product [Oikopleura dioica]
MNSALLSQIQGGKGLKKVPAHAKNDRSEIKGSGDVVGASNNNSQGASRGPPMPPGGGRKGPVAGGPPKQGLSGIHAKLNEQFGGSSIPSKPSGGYKAQPAPPPNFKKPSGFPAPPPPAYGSQTGSAQIRGHAPRVPPQTNKYGGAPPPPQPSSGKPTGSAPPPPPNSNKPGYRPGAAVSAPKPPPTYGHGRPTPNTKQTPANQFPPPPAYIAGPKPPSYNTPGKTPGCHNWTKIFGSSGLLPILFEKFSPIRPIAGPILFANWRQLANRPIGGQSPIGQNWPIGPISPIGPIFSWLLFV